MTEMSEKWQTKLPTDTGLPPWLQCRVTECEGTKSGWIGAVWQKQPRAGQASHAMLVWTWLCWASSARCCWVRGLGLGGLVGGRDVCPGEGTLFGVGDDVVVGVV